MSNNEKKLSAAMLVVVSVAQEFADKLSRTDLRLQNTVSSSGESEYAFVSVSLETFLKKRLDELQNLDPTTRAMVIEVLTRDLSGAKATIRVEDPDARGYTAASSSSAATAAAGRWA